MSRSRAQANPALIEKLGTPIQMGKWATGTVNTTSTGGTALLVMPILGPKGMGTLAVSAHKQAGDWHYDQMIVAVEGGGKVNLLNESEQKQRELQMPSDSVQPEPTSN